MEPASQGGADPDLRWRTRKWKPRVFPQRAGNTLGAVRGPPKAHPGSRTRMTLSHSLGDFFRPSPSPPADSLGWILGFSLRADGSTPISRDPGSTKDHPLTHLGRTLGGSDGTQSGGSAVEERSVHAPAGSSLASTPPGWSPALAPGPAPSARHTFPAPSGSASKGTSQVLSPSPWNLSACSGIRVRPSVSVSVCVCSQ